MLHAARLSSAAIHSIPEFTPLQHRSQTFVKLSALGRHGTTDQKDSALLLGQFLILRIGIGLKG